MDSDMVILELRLAAKELIGADPEVWNVGGMGRVITFNVNSTSGLKRSDLNLLGKRMIPLVEKVLKKEGFPDPSKGDLGIHVSLQRKLAYVDVVVGLDYYEKAMLDNFLMEVVIARGVEKLIAISPHRSL